MVNITKIPNLEEGLKAAKYLFKGISKSVDISDDVFKHYRDFARANADDLEKLADWPKKLKEDGIELSDEAKKYIDDGHFDALINPHRLRVLSDFGEKFNAKLYGSAEFADHEALDMIRQLKIDINNHDGVQLGEDLLRKYITPLENECLQGVDDRNIVLKIYEKRFADAADPVARAREEWANKAAMGGKTTNGPTPASGGSNTTPPGGTTPPPSGSGSGTPPPTGGGGSGTPPPTGGGNTLNNVKELGTKFKEKASETLSSLFNRNADTPKLLAERVWYQNTFGAWRSYAANAMELPNFIKAIRETDRAVPFHLPSFSIGRIHMRPRIKDFDNALNTAKKITDDAGDVIKQTSALKETIGLQSDLKELIQAFSKNDMSKDDFLRAAKDIFTERADDPAFKQTLTSFKDELVKMREDFEKIIPVTDETKKYSFKNGMDHHDKARLIAWADDNINRVNWLLDPKDNSGLLKTMKEQLEHAAGSEANFRSDATDYLTAIVKSGIGERIGDDYYARRFGRRLVENADGGFATKNGDIVMQKGKVLERVKLDLEERLAHSYNSETRVRKVPDGDGQNMGADLAKVLERYTDQLNAAGTSDKNWSVTGDLDNIAGAYGDLILKFGGPGESAANNLVRIKKMMEGPNALHPLPQSFASRMEGVIAKADNAYDKAALRSVVDTFRQFTPDSTWPGSQRYMGDKFGVRAALHSMIDRADRGLSNLKAIDFINPINYSPLWVGKSAKKFWSFGGMSSPATDAMTQRWRGMRSHYLDWAMGKKITKNLDNEDLLKKSDSYQGDHYGSNLGKKSYTAEFDKYTPLRIVYRNTGLAALDPTNWNKPLVTFPVDIKPWHVMMPFAVYATGDAGVSTVKYLCTDSEDQNNPVEFALKTGAKWIHDTATPVIALSDAARAGASYLWTSGHAFGKTVFSALDYAFMQSDSERIGAEQFGKNLVVQAWDTLDSGKVDDLGNFFNGLAQEHIGISVSDEPIDVILGLDNKEYNDKALAAGMTSDTLKEHLWDNRLASTNVDDIALEYASIPKDFFANTMLGGYFRGDDTFGEYYIDQPIDWAKDKFNSLTTGEAPAQKPVEAPAQKPEDPDAKTQRQNEATEGLFDGPSQDGGKEKFLKEGINDLFSDASSDGGSNLMRHYNILSQPAAFIAGSGNVTPADDYKAHENLFLQAFAS